MNNEKFDTKFEVISALADGEHAVDDKLVAKFASDEELRSRWADYHRGRAAMHGEVNVALSADFADTLRAKIANEPAILAPRIKAQEPSLPSTPMRRVVSGLAIAATVAAVAIFGLQNFSATQAPGVAPVAQVDAVPEGQSPALLPSATNSQVLPASLSGNATYWQMQHVTPERDAELEARLNMYLADHMGNANVGKMQSVLPYSSLVGYDASE
ncbi:MAG: sigma-E factor negative regulatory protein [Pseudomonadota bacterium]